MQIQKSAFCENELFEDCSDMYITHLFRFCDTFRIHFVSFRKIQLALHNTDRVIISLVRLQIVNQQKITTNVRIIYSIR